LVRSGGRLRARPCGGGNALSRPLARHLQPCRPPQPVSAAGAHGMTVAAEEDPHAPIAVAWILRRQLLHPRHHGGILRRLAAVIIQCRSCHREQRAAPPRREPALPAILNLPPASRHAHHFFAATSFITSISRSRSATSFFNRAFSASAYRAVGLEQGRRRRFRLGSGRFSSVIVSSRPKNTPSTCLKNITACGNSSLQLLPLRVSKRKEAPSRRAISR
jgi:hypothetical protein